MNYPVMDYANAYSGLGSKIGQTIEAIPAAIQEQEKLKREREAYDQVQEGLKNKKEARLILTKAAEEAVDKSPYNIDDKAKVKAVWLKRIAASNDVEESAKKIAQFQMQTDIYNRAKQENPGAILISPNIDYTEDQFQKQIDSAIAAYKKQSEEGNIKTAQEYALGTPVGTRPENPPLSSQEIQGAAVGTIPGTASDKIYQGAIETAQGKEAAGIYQGAGGGTGGMTAVVGAQGELPEPIGKIGTLDVQQKEKQDALDAELIKGQQKKTEGTGEDPIKSTFEAMIKAGTSKHQVNAEYKAIEKELADFKKLNPDAAIPADFNKRLAEKEAEKRMAEMQYKEADGAYVNIAKLQSTQRQKATMNSLIETRVKPAAQEVYDLVSGKTQSNNPEIQKLLSDNKGFPGDKKEYTRNIEKILDLSEYPPALHEEIVKEIDKIRYKGDSIVSQPSWSKTPDNTSAPSTEDSVYTQKAMQILTSKGKAVTPANIKAYVDYMKNH